MSFKTCMSARKPNAAPDLSQWCLCAHMSSFMLGLCSHPFNVFQMYSVILWCFEEYYYFAGQRNALSTSETKRLGVFEASDNHLTSFLLPLPLSQAASS